MFPLLKAIRPAECLLLAVLGYVSFAYAGVRPDFLVLMTLFIVMAVAMLQNDWRDRVHDLGKGKRLAYDNPRLFLGWLLLFWTTCSGLIAVVATGNVQAGLLLAALAIIWGLYSETRRIPLVPVTVVSLTVGLSLLVSVPFGADVSELLPLFAAVVFIMFGRETLHDIADTKVDQGYKKTVPTVLGDRVARVAATTALLIGCALLTYLVPFAAVGTIVIIWGLSRVMTDPLVVWVRKRVDVGLGLLALGVGLATSL